jgi:hypothetical protein
MWKEMTTTLDIDSLDLHRIAEFLARATGERNVAGAVVGLTRLRDLLVDHLSCSMLEAERVLDTMIGLRLLVLRKDPRGGPPLWNVALE